MKRDLDFGIDNISVLYMKILIPTILGMVSSIIVIITDGIFVGRFVGSQALAAINISAPIFMISTGIALMFGMGSSVQAASKISIGKKKLANIIISDSIYTSLSLFFIISSILFLFTSKISYFLGSTDNLLPMVVNYIRILSPSLLFYMLQNIGLFIIRLDGNPRFAMKCSLLPAFINILGDYILVKELNLGISGAAIATSLSYFIGGFMVIIYFNRNTNGIVINKLSRSYKSIKNSITNSLHVCKLGFSGLLSELAIAFMALIGNYLFLKYLGEDGIAAFSVACYYFPIIFMLNNAIAQSAQPIISYNHGIKKNHRVNRTLRVSIYVGIIIGLLITLFMCIYNSEMVVLFLKKGTSAYLIAKKGIPYFASGFIFFAVNIIIVGYYQSIEKIRTANTISILRGYIILAICFSTLPLIFGVEGIWLSIPASEFISLCIFLAYAFRKRIISS